MESVRCRQCGLVGWPDNETISCKRCGGPIWKTNDYGAGFSFTGARTKSLFSGVIKFLTVVLSVTIFLFLIFKVLHLMPVDAGRVLGGVFFVIGLGCAIFMNFWLLAAIFGESVGWGLATIFLPFAGLVALIKFWDKTQRPFIAHLISVGIIFVAFLNLGP